jgi:hypothetical protein
VELSCLKTRKTLHQVDGRPLRRIARLNLTYFVATRNDAIGTKRTNWTVLAMSVDLGETGSGWQRGKTTRLTVRPEGANYQ